MKAFADLLERLAFTPGRNAKLALLERFFHEVPDPDRGYALAVLTGGLETGQAKPALLRALVAERVDAELFAMSYDFVGDLAETIALIWPARGPERDVPLTEVVEGLARAGKAEVPGLMARWLDALGPSERLALIKLVTGGLRVGISARLALTGLARIGTVPVEEIGELWAGFTPPYAPLFAWLEGGPRPEITARAPFRPVMLSTPLTEPDLATLDPADFAAEWKWDGIRVQAVAEGGTARLYTRTGEDISAAFPEITAGLRFDGALDGELLVRRGEEVAPFADLQKRLGRKAPGKAMLASHPAALRLYDILIWQGEDLRPLPWSQRRPRLEAAVATLDPARFDASPRLAFADWEALAALRADPPAAVIEGVMLKRLESAYVAGRPRGPWFKWKREPMVVDAVILYAQRGHGKRSGFYSDFTFGLWDGDRLVPVGKAYSGFTDEELGKLDRFVRAHTIDRFGPVRSLKPALVVEVAFEGLNRSPRHKSGVAMRFPRISRIRWDKPAEEADRLTALTDILDGAGA
ncbi:cisplatin damage response ATP-dependent DNA ligase [Pararhodobacter aggregans]|uniref:DNA ligase (ATP) n=1 Tax=Pararhodobacter aggregans TaxID=404875 RepID=A0A2T7UQ76_9RHOB|nr:cisplatin damage response ATP-dependent DNA ligase [Pararhodobacter aggregans]PTX01613.1 DNA ligase-1 [Pararhodobacter aggregans]PVE46873.1 ATP-dependent DNA ligase [Pararhodobacter aggregans]